MSLDEVKSGQQKDLWRSIKENTTTVVVALTLALIIRIFIAEPRYRSFC
ncbi:MAG: hypothetical protein AAFR89_06755 [Cyanobacteria bacterium J06633_1]